MSPVAYGVIWRSPDTGVMPLGSSRQPASRHPATWKSASGPAGAVIATTWAPVGKPGSPVHSSVALRPARSVEAVGTVRAIDGRTPTQADQLPSGLIHAQGGRMAGRPTAPERAPAPTPQLPSSRPDRGSRGQGGSDPG